MDKLQKSLLSIQIKKKLYGDELFELEIYTKKIQNIKKCIFSKFDIISSERFINIIEYIIQEYNYEYNIVILDKNRQNYYINVVFHPEKEILFFYYNEDIYKEFEIEVERKNNILNDNLLLINQNEFYPDNICNFFVFGIVVSSILCVSMYGVYEFLK